jgi:WD40 repeat protein
LDSGFEFLKFLSKEQIASSDYFGEIRIWNLNSGECLRTFKANHLFHKCYLKKVTRSCGLLVKIWDTDPGNCLKVLQSKIGTIIDLL